MAWPKPEYSRTQVDKAGKILRKSCGNIQDKKTIQILNNWRSSHSCPMNTFQTTLRLKLKKIDKKAIAVQRLKRTPSIINKLHRFPQMKLSRMQDIGGLRAVVKSLKELHILEENYKKSRFRHRLVKEQDYISKPKDSGYRGIHLIYRYENKNNPEYNGLLLELQIRTKIQHAWATAVETMGVLLQHSLKSSEGPEEWLNFFSLTGSAFSLLEGDSPLPQYKDLTEQETFQKVTDKVEQLKISERLNSFAVATNAITMEEKTTGSYHLIILKPNAKHVLIKTYGLKNLGHAIQDYAEEEWKIIKGENLQVVLVTASSIKGLKNAYPNFFLNTRSFLHYLHRIKEKL